jgi:catechol 2,3-dioxygenase-like lactoylglutathione lyase family enzyme
VSRFLHVNVGVDVGRVDDETAFLTELLGLRPAAHGPEARPTSRWYETDDGCQVHLSEDPDHRPAARAHVALDLGDDLPAAMERLRAAGLSPDLVDANGVTVVMCRDPSGNRWELRGA